MATSTVLLQTAVSSTGQMLTDTIPGLVYIFGLLIAILGALMIGREIKRAGRKLM